MPVPFIGTVCCGVHPTQSGRDVRACPRCFWFCGNRIVGLRACCLPPASDEAFFPPSFRIPFQPLMSCCLVGRIPVFQHPCLPSRSVQLPLPSKSVALTSVASFSSGCQVVSVDWRLKCALGPQGECQLPARLLFL